jgi:GNAT superfamily N-acetyltransferase
MEIELCEEPMTALTEYARVSIAFEVDRILVASAGDGLGEIVMTERKIEVPYLKDYDAIEGGGVTQWAKLFDMTNWGLIAAHLGGWRVGGTVIAFNTKGVDMLENRGDLAVLWDLRVHPEFRRQKVGSTLFRAAEEWAMRRGCRQLKVETQNINFAACRFYARHGCVLEAVNHFAYREFPDETQLLWYKRLGAIPKPNSQTSSKS